MLLFGHVNQEEQIKSISEIPLSDALVRSVATSSLVKIIGHVVVVAIVTMALFEASERMTGFNAGVIYLLSSLGAFYIFFGLVAIYAIYKPHGLALRGVNSGLSFYNKDSHNRMIFWTIHHELFPPDWK
jgi:hypothetical protein